MIDDPPLLTIAKTMPRPSADVVARFANTPTSFIVDALGGQGALDWRIKSIAPMAMVGVALTCDNGPADNLALCAAVSQCQPGDVLVAATDGYTKAAVTGDLLLGIAKNRGAVGLVTDGMIRDRGDILALGIACFAVGITPDSPARNGPGTVGLPIMCGGRNVRSGDIVIGDADGVVIIPYARIEETLQRLEAVRGAEAAMLAKVRSGLKDVGFIDAILKGGRIRNIDV